MSVRLQLCSLGTPRAICPPSLRDLTGALSSRGNGDVGTTVFGGTGVGVVVANAVR